MSAIRSGDRGNSYYLARIQLLFMKRALPVVIALLLAGLMIVPVPAQEAAGTTAPTAAPSLAPDGTTSPAESVTATETTAAVTPDTEKESEPADDSGDSSAADDSTAKKLPMHALLAIVYAFVGVLLSFLIPVLTKYAIQVNKNGIVRRDRAEIFKLVAPYAATAFQALFIAVVVIAYTLSQKTVIGVDEWFVPFIIGFGSDATITKIKSGGTSDGG